MITVDKGSHSKLIFWNLLAGERLCSIDNSILHIESLCFSLDCSMLATVGLDSQKRSQIIVWDIQLIILENAVKNGENHKLLIPLTPQSSCVIAKQLSDFPIKCIKFSHFEENALVSCGKENIRFLRIRKLHLPGKSVQLNNYSRNFEFNNIEFYNEAGQNPKENRISCVFVSSNQGLLLKINASTEQIIFAVKLHSGSITSFIIIRGIAITGGDDKKLRVWLVKTLIYIYF